MKKAADWSAIDDRLIPLAGRQGEVEELVRALEAGQSRLITGPPGMGKTRLLAEAVWGCAAPYLIVRSPRVLHDLLEQLAAMLGCRVTGTTSMSLKPAILDALIHGPRAVFLKDMAEADPRMYRFLQSIYHTPGNCLIVTAGSRESLGYLRRLLWDPREEIALQPLKRGEAAGLFESAVAAYKLDSLDLDGFRKQVLRSARGNPGQIVTMCRLAARPEYRRGRRVKFVPLRMDAMAAFVGGSLRGRRTQRVPLRACPTVG
jgi:hypothetical protein